MKTSSLFVRPIFLAVALLAFSSCRNMFRGEPGTLSISFDESVSYITKSSSGIPDTEDFILTVADATGKMIYNGRFGDSPEEFSLNPGSYTISAVSCEFDEPAYDRPQYGDSQVAVVRSGESVSVLLSCSQQNCGLALVVDDSFINTFPGGVLYLEAADGTLMYEYTETRTVWFNPGKVSVKVSEDGTTQSLFSRTLQAQQILIMKLSSSSAAAYDGIEIAVDTSRTWLSDSFRYGHTDASTPENAYTVTEGRERAGEKDVWVYGYIVGCATGTNKFLFEAPFTKETNILLGLRSSTDSADYCISVELPSGSIREALNLVYNPGMLGQQICIKGDLVSSYFGIPGLKSVSEYQFR